MNNDSKLLLEEFYNEKSVTKFSNTSHILFKNNKQMSAFWIINKNEIMQSKDELCKNIVKQYNDYLSFIEVRRNTYYNIRIKQLVNNESYLKFFSDLIKFADGLPMHVFWERYKNQIMLSDGLLEKKVVNQYRLASILYKKKNMIVKDVTSKSADKRLSEFLKIEDDSKFSIDYKGTFENGKLIKNWWCHNRHKLIETDMQIRGQYELYLQKHNDEVNTIYTTRISEFVQADLSKFNSRSHVLFQDASSMYNWWKKSMSRIAASNDETCIEVINQYEGYVATMSGDYGYDDDSIYYRQDISI